MSRDLKLLRPEFLGKLESVLAKAAKAGVHMVPYETQRSVWKQARLWRQSRSAAEVKERYLSLKRSGAEYVAKVLQQVGPQPEGPWATNALPGQSWHQWGLACDLYWDRNGPDVPGGAEWSDMTGYKVFATIARDAGLTSGFFWRSRDAVHVQLPAEQKPSHSMSILSEKMRAMYGDQEQ